MLEIKPISLKQANAYVIENHRHHGKVQGHKYSIGAFDGSVLHGVAIVGRPLSRYLDNGRTLEVIRCCTDGTKNACSILYSRSAKIAKDMGYEKIITYILEEEHGSSLKASGWSLEEEGIGGGDWAKCSRRDLQYEQLSFGDIQPKYPKGKKNRYIKELTVSEKNRNERNGMFKCTMCGRKKAIWQCDFSFDDYGMDGDGIVSTYHCDNCGCDIECMVSCE